MKILGRISTFETIQRTNKERLTLPSSDFFQKLTTDERKSYLQHLQGYGEFFLTARTRYLFFHFGMDKKIKPYIKFSHDSPRTGLIDIFYWFTDAQRREYESKENLIFVAQQGFNSKGKSLLKLKDIRKRMEMDESTPYELKIAKGNLFVFELRDSGYYSCETTFGLPLGDKAVESNPNATFLVMPEVNDKSMGFFSWGISESPDNRNKVYCYSCVAYNVLTVAEENAAAVK